MRKCICVLLTVALLLNIFSMLPVVRTQETKNGNIIFQENAIPNLVVSSRTGRNNESFRFEWLGNKFDLELFFNATYEKKGENVTRLFSLSDFEDDFNVTVNYNVNKNETAVQFGWVIDNIENVSDYVHNAWFKIEDTQPFDYDEIILDVTDSYNELGYNITCFYLPNNLILSFEDLHHKGFVIGSQNKTLTEVKGFSGKSSWDLDPIAMSGTRIIVTGTYNDLCEDILAQDVASGWGVHTKQGQNQYYTNASVQIGNGTVAGTTTVTDKQVHWTIGNVSGNHGLTVCKYATLTLGDYVAFVYSPTSAGALAIYGGGATGAPSSERNYGTINFYGMSFMHMENDWLSFYTAGGEWIGVAVKTMPRTVWVGTCTFTRCIFSYFDCRSPNYDFNECLFEAYSWQLLRVVGSNDASVSNSDFRQHRGTGAFIEAWNDFSAEANITDCVFDTTDCTNIFSQQGAGAGGEVYIQYSLDLNVTYISGATINGTSTGTRVVITHYGQNETVDYNGTLGEDGTIFTQTLRAGFYNATGGNTRYEYNPFNLAIYNTTGYQTYTENFTLNEKTDWTIALQSESVELFDATYFLLGIVIFIPSLFIIGYWRKKKQNAS